MNQWLTPCHPFFVFKDGHFHLSSSQRIISARPSTPRCSCCNRSWKVGIKSATGPFQRQVAIAVPSAKMPCPPPLKSLDVPVIAVAAEAPGKKAPPAPPYPLLFSRALRPIRVVLVPSGKDPKKVKDRNRRAQAYVTEDWQKVGQWRSEVWACRHFW